MLDFKTLFNKWSYTKSGQKILFDDIKKSIKYKNGKIYWFEDNPITFVNQKLDSYEHMITIGRLDCPYNCRLYISNWSPIKSHPSQKATITFKTGYNAYHGGGFTETNVDLVNEGRKYITISSFSNNYLVVLTQGGSITVDIPSYFDTDNNINYSGIQYQVDFEFDFLKNDEIVKEVTYL